jgi:hypothetical protein
MSDMPDIVKICKIHGQLTENQVYRRKPPRKEIVCKKCNNEASNKYRYIEISENITERKCARCKIIKSKTDFKPYQWTLSSPYCNDCRIKNSTKEYHKNRSHLKKDLVWRLRIIIKWY